MSNCTETLLISVVCPQNILFLAISDPTIVTSYHIDSSTCWRYPGCFPSWGLEASNVVLGVDAEISATYRQWPVSIWPWTFKGFFQTYRSSSVVCSVQTVSPKFGSSTWLRPLPTHFSSLFGNGWMSYNSQDFKLEETCVLRGVQLREVAHYGAIEAREECRSLW